MIKALRLLVGWLALAGSVGSLTSPVSITITNPPNSVLSGTVNLGALVSGPATHVDFFIDGNYVGTAVGAPGNLHVTP